MSESSMDAESWALAIEDALKRLEGRLVRTPLIRSRWLSEAKGREVYLKLESLQHGAAFKYRGALNGVLIHREAGREHGIVTSSSGNFGTACAIACRDEGIPLKVVVLPSTAGYKVERSRALGAEVIFCEERYEDRQASVDRLVAETGAIELHSHGSVETIAGNSSLGRELTEQLPELGSIVAPVSGGGLLSGIALGANAGPDGPQVFGVQAEGNRAAVDSFRAKEARVGPTPDTIADGLTATKPAPLGFEVMLERVAGMAAASEEGVRAAVCALFEKEKLVVEPAGAVSVAALLEGKLDALPDPIVLVLSGGNIAAKRLAAWL